MCLSPASCRLPCRGCGTGWSEPIDPNPMIRLSCKTASLYTRGNRRKNTSPVQKGRLPMKRWLIALSVLLSPSAFAQQPPPEIPYDSVANPLKLPPDMHLGEVAGVAVNSKGHIFVYAR